MAWLGGITCPAKTKPAMKYLFAIPLLSAALLLASCKKEEVAVATETAQPAQPTAPQGNKRVDIRFFTYSPCDYSIRVGDNYLTGHLVQDNTLRTFQANSGDSIIVLAIGSFQQNILAHALVNDSLFAARSTNIGACKLLSVVP